VREKVLKFTAAVCSISLKFGTELSTWHPIKRSRSKGQRSRSQRKTSSDRQIIAPFRKSGSLDLMAMSAIPIPTGFPWESGNQDSRLRCRPL